MALVFGVLVGAMSMTAVSDKFGRKRTFLFNACAGSLVVFVTAWVNDYYVFIVLRFVLGIFQQVRTVYDFVFFNIINRAKIQNVTTMNVKVCLV